MRSAAGSTTGNKLPTRHGSTHELSRPTSNRPPPWGIARDVRLAAAVVPGRRRGRDRVLRASGRRDAATAQLDLRRRGDRDRRAHRRCRCRSACWPWRRSLRRWPPAGLPRAQRCRGAAKSSLPLVCVIAIDRRCSTRCSTSPAAISWPPFQVEAYQTRPECRLAVLAAGCHRRCRADRRGDRVPRLSVSRAGAAGPRDAWPSASISLVWALLHIQYDWLGMAQIFLCWAWCSAGFAGPAARPR